MALTDRDEPPGPPPDGSRRRPPTGPAGALATPRALRAAAGDTLARWAATGSARWAALPPWGQVLAIYLATRAFAFVLVDRAARFQPQSVWNPANPGYLDVVSLWDGEWYHRIADSGYPAELPRNADGQVLQNPWAFYPLFPAISRGVMQLTGASWAVAATVVALVCGGAAVVCMRSLLAPLAGPRLALWTVVLFCCYPAAPVLQLAYTESLATLLLVVSLWCLQHRRYLLAVPVVILVGATRPIGVPLAAVIGLHLVRALWRHSVEPVTRGRVGALLVLTATPA
jgi:hypothetical protein